MTGLKKNAETEHLRTPCEASLYQSLLEAKNTLLWYPQNHSVNNGKKSQQISER